MQTRTTAYTLSHMPTEDERLQSLSAIHKQFHDVVLVEQPIEDRYKYVLQ